MSKTFRPLKAPSKGIPDTHIAKIRFPVIVSPKLDGLRALNLNGKGVSSSLKPIRNRHTNKLVSIPELNWMDGEMAVGNGMDAAGFKLATSAMMAEHGQHNITWWVFDLCDPDIHSVPFHMRHAMLIKQVEAANLPYVKVVPHETVWSIEKLLEYEEKMLLDGFEGVMIRDPNGRYKYDRSTLNEGILLKLKRGHVVRGDAEIIGFKERMRNENEATVNERGLSQRSVKKENMVARGDLGSFEVRDCETGDTFSIGTGDGLDDNMRLEVWNNKESYLGKIIRYERFAYGGYSKPRFPKYIEIRHEEDKVAE